MGDVAVFGWLACNVGKFGGRIRRGARFIAFALAKFSFRPTEAGFLLCQRYVKNFV